MLCAYIQVNSTSFKKNKTMLNILSKMLHYKLKTINLTENWIIA